MSGGSLDYGYYKVEELADRIKSRADNTLHIAFALHLYDVAKALHDLEWVWSGDNSSGTEEESILAVTTPSKLQEVGISQLEKAIKDGKEVLASLKNLSGNKKGKTLAELFAAGKE